MHISLLVIISRLCQEQGRPVCQPIERLRPARRNVEGRNLGRAGAGLTVEVLVFGFPDLGCKGQGCRLKVLIFRVWGLGFRVEG